MGRRRTLTYLLSLCLFLPAAWGSEVIQTQQEVLPGDPLAVRLHVDPLVPEVTVLLWDSDSRQNLLVEGKAFRIPAVQMIGQENGQGIHTGDTEIGIGSALWIGILGIPTLIPPGSYRLEIRLGGVSYMVPISVRGRQFLHEEIALNKEMSKLRTEEDARKIEEMRELLERVKRFEPQSMYHLRPFRLPVEGFRRTSQFGDRRKYRYADGATDQAIHTGIDFATPRGTPIGASAAGKVVFAGPRILTGNTVVLEHLPGVYSLYYHLDRIEVNEGTLVREGERIGTSGATGLVTGPHLHWEIRVGGIPVNPDAFLKAGPLDKFFQLRETAVESKEGR
jgi:hypothetical protein